MNKKLCAILFSLMIMLCGCTSKTVEKDTLSQIIENDIIKVGVKVDTPPFGYLDKNNTNVNVCFINYL